MVREGVNRAGAAVLKAGDLRWVSRVKNMQAMLKVRARPLALPWPHAQPCRPFFGCQFAGEFNQPLDLWNVARVQSCGNMFQHANSISECNKKRIASVFDDAKDTCGTSGWNAFTCPSPPPSPPSLPPPSPPHPCRRHRRMRHAEVNIYFLS